MPEIIPHPFKGDQRIFPLGIESRAAEGAGDRPVVTVVGTDGSEDRHGSVINPNGWDIESYERNPVVLWGHQAADIPAIGKTINLRRSGGQWLFDIEFATEQWRHMASNLAATTYELMRDGFLNAVSVSFIPKEWADREAKTIPSFFAENVEYKRQELTEISVVNIGSNRNALQKALEAGKLTEEGARMLGLGEHIRISMPIVIVGKSEESAPVVEPPADDAPDFTAMREKIAAILRCCGCYPTYQEPEVVELEPEQKRFEMEAMTDLVVSLTAALDDALHVWRQTVNPQLRSYTSSIALSCMFSIEWLLTRAHEWYGETPTVAAPAMDLEEFERAVGEEGYEPIDLEEIRASRAGAVLNQKNRTRLDQAKALIDDVLASAAKPSEEPEDEERGANVSDNVLRVMHPGPVAPDAKITLRITGPTEPGSVPLSGQPIRITATDSADSRAADESTPQERGLYHILLDE